MDHAGAEHPDDFPRVDFSRDIQRRGFIEWRAMEEASVGGDSLPY